MRCTVCPITHVPNSIFCDECGSYLLQGKELSTDPIDIRQLKWLGDAEHPRASDTNLPDIRPPTIRLRIGPRVGRSNQARELQISLTKPIRLGRTDPMHDVFPEVDLTQDLGREHGVSRLHICIFRQGNTVKVEDLGSTNGTLLNGERLDPYMPETLSDGDQFQLGELLIGVGFES
jgi:pSer/pThr/pTyr-binding forkhead associated (FHA) protein